MVLILEMLKVLELAQPDQNVKEDGNICTSDRYISAYFLANQVDN